MFITYIDPLITIFQLNSVIVTIKFGTIPCQIEMRDVMRSQLAGDSGHRIARHVVNIDVSDDS